MSVIDGDGGHDVTKCLGCGACGGMFVHHRNGHSDGSVSEGATFELESDLTKNPRTSRMGTLLGGVVGVCVIAGSLFSAHSTLDLLSNDRGQIRATANPSTIVELRDVEAELRVIETRLEADGRGVLVFDRSGARDSVMVEASVLEMVAVGDVLSENEGTIER